VGTFVDVQHVAATVVNRRIVAHAEVTRVDGRHIEFRVRALDGDDEIGRGRHGRVLIDLARFDELLAAKVRAKPA
jgi:predicted thioesterase